MGAVSGCLLPRPGEIRAVDSDPEWKNWTKALTGDVGSALVSLPWKMCSQRSHLLSLGKAGPRRGSPFGVSKGSDVNASKPVVNTGAHMPA